MSSSALGRNIITMAGAGISTSAGPFPRDCAAVLIAAHNQSRPRPWAFSCCMGVRLSIQLRAKMNGVAAATQSSCFPAGIPDFRSPGTGLYDNLQKYNLPVSQDGSCITTAVLNTPSQHDCSTLRQSSPFITSTPRQSPSSCLVGNPCPVPLLNQRAKLAALDCLLACSGSHCLLALCWPTCCLTRLSPWHSQRVVPRQL